MTNDKDGFALRDSVVAIVGLGLMGGSLALALRGRCANIVAIDHDERTLDQARPFIGETSTDLSLARTADVIVLAMPVRAIIEQMPRIGELAREDAIVLDLGSTKREVVRAMENLPAHIQAIGAHPMCGKETSGFDSADANLFCNAPFVLTPLARTPASLVTRLSSLITHLGARPLILDAARHDKIVAAISHLPFALAAALMMTAGESAHEDDLVFALAANGFRDTSRLAASDPTMMLDILLTNRDNVAEAIRAGARNLETLADAIERGDEISLHAMLQSAAEQRRGLFK
ncbi:prephenate dehydrogenase [Anaerolineae bacterium]|nr:prephenate dehydrogenase [Anaerolineae bacterium]